MKSILLFVRYLVFVLFVACNAIICPIAVWNLSLASSVGQLAQIDAFLTFLGAFALVFTFALIFIEILRKNALTGRLWFEVLWVSLFWLMELSGAAALSAIAPKIFCAKVQATVLDMGACNSMHVLLTFTWITTITLLSYLGLLVTVAIIRQTRDPQIWQSDMQEFCRADTKLSLGSTPASPSLPRFGKDSEVPDFFAPQPRRSVQSNAHAHRSGLGPEFQIEYYQPERPIPPVPAAAPPHHMVQSSRAAATASWVSIPSLYPQYMASSVTPQIPARSYTSSPPPLGNWPSARAVDQPMSIQGKRRTPPPLDLSKISAFRANGSDV